MAENEKQEPRYAKPASQVDLEERLENGNESDSVLSTSEYAKDAKPDDPTEGYVGVDPMYQNSANHTEAPGVSSKSAEDKVAARFMGQKKVTDVSVTTEDEGDESEAEESSSTPAAKKAATSRSSASS